MPAVFSVITPHPYRHPVAAPDAPVGREFLRFIGQGRHSIGGIGVCGYRVGRDMFIQVHDLRYKGILGGIGAADGYRDGDCLRCGGGMPLDPDHLAVTCGDHHIVDSVGGAEDVEGHRSGIIRRQVGIRPQGDRGNDIGIYPVLHIGGFNIPLGRGFIKPDDADAQCIDDVGIVLRPGGVAGPGGNTKVAELQKHGQRQVLMGQRGHGPAQVAAGHLIVKAGLGGRHAVILAVVGKVGDGLDQQLIFSSDHPLIVHTRSLGDHHAGIFRAEVPLDGVNVALALAADDGGHGLRGLDAGIGHPGLEGEAGAAQVLQFVDFAKMKDAAFLRPVGKVQR